MRHRWSIECLFDLVVFVCLIFVFTYFVCVLFVNSVCVLLCVVVVCLFY